MELLSAVGGLLAAVAAANIFACLLEGTWWCDGTANSEKRARETS